MPVHGLLPSRGTLESVLALQRAWFSRGHRNKHWDATSNPVHISLCLLVFLFPSKGPRLLLLKWMGAEVSSGWCPVLIIEHCKLEGSSVGCWSSALLKVWLTVVLYHIVEGMVQSSFEVFQAWTSCSLSWLWTWLCFLCILSLGIWKQLKISPQLSSHTRSWGLSPSHGHWELQPCPQLSLWVSVGLAALYASNWTQYCKYSFMGSFTGPAACAVADTSHCAASL